MFVYWTSGHCNMTIFFSIAILIENEADKSGYLSFQDGTAEEANDIEMEQMTTVVQEQRTADVHVQEQRSADVHVQELRTADVNTQESN